MNLGCDDMMNSSQVSNCLHCQDHQIVVHGIDFGERFACPECHDVFQTNKQLKSHITRKHVRINLTCDICNQVSKDESGLQKHMENVHWRKNIQVCDHDFDWFINAGG